MRIIAGQWRGRPLKAPDGLATRPTADRARETLFSMLLSRLGSFEGLTVLDAYAGSGALGLEALSRGGAHAHFIERDAAAVAAIRANIKTLGAAATVHTADATRPPRATVACDVAFFDPPYDDPPLNALLALDAAGWLAPSCWVSIETAKGIELHPEGWTVDAVRPVGKAQLTLLTR